MSVIIVDIFDSIVDSMRATGTITNLSDDGTTTTVTSVNSLTAREIVTMDSVDYMVLSATSALFTVTGTGLTASSWKAKAPYYEYGHPQEISDTLLAKADNNTFKYQKYPLIALFTDIGIQRGNPKIYGKWENGAISIIGLTKKSYSSKQRYDNNIQTILYPLYVTLLKKIKSKRNFIGTTPNVDHKLFERPFWGSTSKYGNIKSMFNDPLDALELSRINIELREGNTCNN